MITILCSTNQQIILNQQKVNKSVYPTFTSEKAVKQNLNAFDEDGSFEILDSEATTNSTFSSMIHDTEVQILKNNESMDFLQKKIQILENENLKVNKLRNLEIVEKENIQSQYVKLQDQYKIRENENFKIKKEIQQSEQLEQANKELQKRLEEQEFIIKSQEGLEQENETLKKLLLEKEAEKDDLERKLTEKDIFTSSTDATIQENEELKKKIKEQTKKMLEQENIINNLKKQLEEKTIDLEKALNRINVLEKKCEEYRMEILSLKTEMNELKMQNIQLSKKHDELESKQKKAEERERIKQVQAEEKRKQKIKEAEEQKKREEAKIKEIALEKEFMVQVNLLENFVNNAKKSFEKFASLSEKFTNLSKEYSSLQDSFTEQSTEYQRVIERFAYRLSDGSFCYERHLSSVVNNYIRYKNSFSRLFSSVDKCCSSFDYQACNAEANRILATSNSYNLKIEEIKTITQKINNIKGNINKEKNLDVEALSEKDSKTGEKITISASTFLQKFKKFKESYIGMLSGIGDINQEFIKDYEKQTLRYAEYKKEYVKFESQIKDLSNFFNKEQRRVETIKSSCRKIDDCACFSIMDI